MSLFADVQCNRGKVSTSKMNLQHNTWIEQQADIWYLKEKEYRREEFSFKTGLMNATVIEKFPVWPFWFNVLH